MPAVTGSFTSTGQSSPISLAPFFANKNEGLTYYNITVHGTFSATIKVERSFDDGATWHVISDDAAGTEVSFTTPVSLMLREPEPQVQYRLNCTSYTSGTANYRISHR